MSDERLMPFLLVVSTLVSAFAILVVCLGKPTLPGD